ncbi:MAG: hypothetical protein ABI168_10495 [Ginsengibacter sp.]
MEAEIDGESYGRIQWPQVEGYLFNQAGLVTKLRKRLAGYRVSLGTSQSSKKA